VKKNNFKLIFILYVLFFYLISISTNKQYILSSSYKSVCAVTISTVDQYIQLIPNDTWIVTGENGIIKINTVFNKKKPEIIKLKKIKNRRLANNIFKYKNFDHAQKDKECTSLNTHIKIKPLLLLVDQTLIDNGEKNHIKYFIFFLNLLLIIFSVKQLEKINLSKLSR